MSEVGTWRRCSACKEPIALGAQYWVCNVSTCNRKRTALAFCSVTCWEVHLPGANHRESWAEEREAPAVAESAEVESTPERPAAKRRLVRPAESRSHPAPSAPSAPSAAPQEVLVVASRLKDYVRAVSGMNTSDRVLEPLSKIVRRACEEAVENARRDGRRTILDRDVRDAD